VLQLEAADELTVSSGMAGDGVGPQVHEEGTGDTSTEEDKSEGYTKGRFRAAGRRG